VERRRKGTRERSHQQVFRCPPAFETAELRWRGEMNCVRGRFRFGDARLSGRPPSHNAILMFIFHSVLRVLLAFSESLRCYSPTDSEDGNVTVNTAFVPDDSVPADPVRQWPRSRLFVMPITHRVLQYAELGVLNACPLRFKYHR
jgi:hypothetical protein